ncbi:MAG TPA: protein-(glutamine-N5) methyltransferase, release factor-specific, partial [Firmicutes bacterium]|nr:protein-(glutamine-N5) methyltransferase, release factor-specific [Bacillota bacterium]
IGWDQAREVRALGEEAGLTWLQTVQDYGGRDRVVVFQWKS